MTTLAGLAGSSGSTDGTGGAARFYKPCGVAADSAGNVLVADTYNHTIRTVTQGGVVTTLAGLAGSSGSADGTGSVARFCEPGGVAVDGAGNVYVADMGNRTIRKVTSEGVVTTIGGVAGISGGADGVGGLAIFSCPKGIGVDSTGNLYVADSWNNRISKGTPLLDGDVDGDGHVDVIDLLWLIDTFGKSAGDAGYNAACDFNGDGAVDVIDLLTMIGNFGT